MKERKIINANVTASANHPCTPGIIIKLSFFGGTLQNEALIKTAWISSLNFN